MLVPVANARVDEDTMVIGLCHAALADVAVLGARGLDELTGSACAARVEEGVVVGVETEMVALVLEADVARVCRAGEIEEEIGEDDGDDGGRFG